MADAFAAKPRSVAAIAAAQVMVLALWFVSSAVATDLAAAGVSDAQLARLALAVQLGFALASLASAGLGLPDRVPPRRLFAAGAVLGAAANALLLILDPSGPGAVVARGLAGAAMAAVYPVGMKLAASWAKGDTGLLIGLLVGALTLGSASPHLFAFAGGVSWKLGVAAASLSAVAGAGVIFVAAVGPGHKPAGRFTPAAALDIWRLRGVRLATLGYLGHMWELYAMWAWIGAFLAASFAVSGLADAAAAAKLAAFTVVGAGAAGCVAAGWLADRLGRTAVTSAAMAVSGACCLAIGPLFGGPVAALVAVALVWGVAVVADSAQFSAAVAELAPPERVGALLTLQTAAGFLLTAVTIRLVPAWVDAVGWEWAFAPLAIGPALGVAAMLRLRAVPESAGLAGGRR